MQKIFFSNTYERKHAHRLTTNIDGAEKGTLVESELWQGVGSRWSGKGEIVPWKHWGKWFFRSPRRGSSFVVVVIVVMIVVIVIVITIVIKTEYTRFRTLMRSIKNKEKKSYYSKDNQN